MALLDVAKEKSEIGLPDFCGNDRSAEVWVPTASVAQPLCLGVCFNDEFAGQSSCARCEKADRLQRALHPPHHVVGYGEDR